MANNSLRPNLSTISTTVPTEITWKYKSLKVLEILIKELFNFNQFPFHSDKINIRPLTWTIPIIVDDKPGSMFEPALMKMS